MSRQASMGAEKAMHGNGALSPIVVFVLMYRHVKRFAPVVHRQVKLFQRLSICDILLGTNTSDLDNSN